MASSFFKFKQFTIHHDKATMKVGTDGVLLGTWTNVNNAKTILDIGTGSGLIALMLAQRTSPDVTIDAVEIDLHNAEQAIENVSLSPWKEKVNIHHTSIQEFVSQKKYDLIVSNPPYFKNSYQPPDAKRTIARHTTTLSFDDLILSVKTLLHEEGKFSVVLPYVEGLQFITLAEQKSLYCTRKWSFKSRKEKAIERLLLEFAFIQGDTETHEIILYSQAFGEEWSDDYKALTKDFYLKI